MKAVARGVGRWAGGEKAPAKLLPARIRRRATRLTRIVAEAVAAALEDAGLEADALEEARIVLVSDWGELGATATLLETLRTEPSATSPIAFTNSVHNTATGYLSLALKDREGSTAVAGGPERGGLALCEAMLALDPDVDLQGGAGLALVVVADEAVPDELADGRATEESALAILLAREGTGRPLALRRGAGDARDEGDLGGTRHATQALMAAFAKAGASEITLPGGWELSLSAKRT